jgi:ankyrin repeat protein
MSEYEIALTVEFFFKSKASAIVDLVQKARKYIETNGDVALHNYLEDAGRTHGIDFDSWWIPVSAELIGKQVKLKMAGSPSGTIEQDLVTWIKKEGGKKIQGDMTSENGIESVVAMSNSDVRKIKKDIKLREKLYGPTKSGDLNELKKLLKKLKNIDAVEPWTGETALMLACSNGHLEMVEYLISNRADVNYVNEQEGTTALFNAANSDHAAIVKTLVENGASVDYLSSDQKNAFGIS